VIYRAHSLPGATYPLHGESLFVVGLVTSLQAARTKEETARASNTRGRRDIRGGSVRSV